MADNDQLIKQIGKLIDEKIEPINKRFDGLEQGQRNLQGDVSGLRQGQEQTNATLSKHDTILDALKAGQDDIRENMATKQDVERIEQEVDKLKKRLPPYRAD